MADQSLLQIIHNLQTLGICSDLDLSTIGESNSSLFDRILTVLYTEIHKGTDARPLPASLADGRPVNLFRLFSVVQARGGFSSVSAVSGWTSVAEEVGFEPEFGSAVRLVFFKYLEVLEKSLRRVSGRDMCAGVGFDGLPTLSDKCVEVEVKEVGNFREKADFSPRSMFGLKKENFLSTGQGFGRRLQFENGGSGDSGVLISVKNEGNRSANGLKRKRDDIAAMLDWIRKVAKNPTNCCWADAVCTDKAKVKSCVNKDIFSQLVRARKGMFQNITRGGVLESNIQKGARLQSTEVNGFHNLHESNKQLTRGSCAKALEFLNHDRNTNGLLAAARRDTSDVRQKLRSSSLIFNQAADCLFGDQYRIRVPVGPLFQAEVPAWTGKPALPCIDSVELKWLGMRIWPPEIQENKLLLNHNSIGRGRLDKCRCKQPGSVECIRFHIAESRLQLNRELGPAFYAWGFESMGEEVATSWTEEEERKFKAIVRLYRPSLNKNFWDQLPLCFPFKGRRKLASYYFNVFLLRRRSYQNRVTPYITDSDDDEESESGFLSSHVL